MVCKDGIKPEENNSKTTTTKRQQQQSQQQKKRATKRHETAHIKVPNNKTNYDNKNTKTQITKRTTIFIGIFIE